MKISVRTIPPAPIPVKTAYTVPTGKSLYALNNKTKLIVINRATPAHSSGASAF